MKFWCLNHVRITTFSLISMIKNQNHGSTSAQSTSSTTTLKMLICRDLDEILMNNDNIN